MFWGEEDNINITTGAKIEAKNDNKGSYNNWVMREIIQYYLI